jgi:hypothetical protein
MRETGKPTFVVSDHCWRARLRAHGSARSRGSRVVSTHGLNTQRMSAVQKVWSSYVHGTILLQHGPAADALCLHANKEPKDIHDSFALLKANSEDNPVAKLKASTAKQNGMEPGNAARCEPDRVPPRANLCKTAEVQLTGHGPRPEWGLCHGSRGAVIDLVFAVGESPNNNGLPLVKQ